MGANLPGQSLSLCGQAIQVAAWRAHSAGIRRGAISEVPVSTVEEALGDGGVGVDAPVAQERPVAAHVLDASAVALDDEDLLLGPRAFLEDDAERIGHERAAPELQAAVGRSLVPDAVDGRHVDAVGDGMGALNRLPRRGLRRAVLLLLLGMP